MYVCRQKNCKIGLTGSWEKVFSLEDELEENLLLTILFFSKQANFSLVGLGLCEKSRSLLARFIHFTENLSKFKILLYKFFSTKKSLSIFVEKKNLIIKK